MTLPLLRLKASYSFLHCYCKMRSLMGRKFLDLNALLLLFNLIDWQGYDFENLNHLRFFYFFFGCFQTTLEAGALILFFF